MQPYLALDGIRVGDIILSSSRTATSYFIRLATFSTKASHAAIAIHPFIWFEATTQGCGYTIQQPSIVWDGHDFRLGAPIACGDSYTVRRLKTGPYKYSDSASRHKFAHSLILESSKYAFLNYALAKDFLPLLRFSLGETAAARFIANNLDKSRTKFFPGPFCSWLVAECYRNVGQPLFNRPSHKVTPGSLERCRKLETCNSTFVGDVIKLKQRFARLETEIRLATALSAHFLRIDSFLADTAKDLFEIDASMNSALALLSRGLKVPGLSESIGSPQDSWESIGENVKASFLDLQTKIISTIGLAYYQCAPMDEHFSDINMCAKKCRDVLAVTVPDYCDNMGCSSQLSKYVEAAEILKQAFPMPRFEPRVEPSVKERRPNDPET